MLAFALLLEMNLGIQTLCRGSAVALCYETMSRHANSSVQIPSPSANVNNVSVGASIISYCSLLQVKGGNSHKGWGESWEHANTASPKDILQHPHSSSQL